MRKKNWIINLWIFFIALSFFWNYYMTTTNTLKLVENKAQSFFTQILVARSWNSAHGAVYVPVTAQTQPNIYLIDSLRDVTTLNGLKLTKINPAYMTRQISEINKAENDLQFHITSLNPIRPANKADDWERKALESFESGKREFLELIDNNSTSQYRYMAPLLIEKSCLKCHAVQGYKLGEIRGGISISFPSKIYNEAESQQLYLLFFVHLLILIVGLWGIYLFFKMSDNFIAIIEQKNIKLKSDSLLLWQSNDELQKLIAEKDKFFSIIAHDLRGPLSSFHGITQLMIEELPYMELTDLQELSVSMEKSATNLYRLLENLLEWAKMQRGLIPYNPKVIQLFPSVKQSTETLVDSIKNKEIKIIYDIPVDIRVIADTNMLQTVIRNLVSNAVKFTPKGGKISLSAKTTADKSVEISVRDTGIGMDQARIDNLFRIDVQTNRIGTEGEPSTGLGLILCKEFIEKHNGKIGVESEEGKGSRFFFTIPGPAEPKEINVPENVVSADLTENLIKDLKILIAEDDETSGILISISARKFGKEIIIVRTGTEAVEACRNNPDIDLILMDVQMPEMDGYEATRQIRQFYTGVIIIAQTAFALEGDKEKALEAGCTDYISKPIRKEQLVDLMEKYFI